MPVEDRARRIESVIDEIRKNIKRCRSHDLQALPVRTARFADFRQLLIGNISEIHRKLWGEFKDCICSGLERCFRGCFENHEGYSTQFAPRPPAKFPARIESR